LLENYLKVNSGTAALYSRLGNLYVSSGFKPDAIKSHEKAVELAPDDPEVWHLYGISLFFFRELDRSVNALEKAYSLNPLNAELIKNLAVGYFYQRRFEEALTYLRLADSRGYKIDDDTMREFESYYFDNEIPSHKSTKSK